jgi:hypothetical protein
VMFSAIRRRMHMSPTGVVAVLALVFAMTGGAYAASRYVITSTKQISPKVLKALKGAAGSAGANGAQGPAGPAGASGAKGENGAAGANGGDGVSVTSSVEPKGANCKEGGSKFVAASGTTYACNGEKGKNGTFEGQALPAGKTLTGVYAASGFGEAGVPDPGFGIAQTGVSFALPVPGEPAFHYIKENETPPVGCTGSAAKPGADEGNLCVFGEAEENVPSGQPLISLRGSTESSLGFSIEDTSAKKGYIALSGTWAVTAG